jgi:hypothetical protein
MSFGRCAALAMNCRLSNRFCVLPDSTPINTQPKLLDGELSHACTSPINVADVHW